MFGALRTKLVIKIAVAVENMKLYDTDDADLEPVREPEADDDLIVLEEINSGESGVMVAAPTQTEVQNTKKRKQPAITDFFLKKHK